MEIVIGIIGVSIIVFGQWFLRKSAIARRAAFIDQYEFPASLEKKFLDQYPQLEVADAQLALRGLRDYFHICNQASGKGVAMPSQAVDVLWHAFLLYTREYQKFCQQAFGRFLHHTPAEAMESQKVAQVGIKRAWRLACARQGLEPSYPIALPLLFAIDQRLEIPDGFTYQLNCHGKEAKGYCASHIHSSSPASGCGGFFTDGDAGCSSGCSGGGCGGD